jgi:hypothetical protein
MSSVENHTNSLDISVSDKRAHDSIGLRRLSSKICVVL